MTRVPLIDADVLLSYLHGARAAMAVPASVGDEWARGAVSALDQVEQRVRLEREDALIEDPPYGTRPGEVAA